MHGGSPVRTLRRHVSVIEPLVLEDCEQAGCDHQRRRSAGADLPSVDMSTESDVLGPGVSRLNRNASYPWL